MKRLLMALTLGFVISSGTVTPGQSATVPTVGVMERWLAAVQTHVPGTDDDAWGMARTLSLEDRKAMHTSLQFVLDALAGKPVLPRTSEDKRLAMLVKDIRSTTSESAFLTRAVILHGDAAMLRYTGPDIRPVPPGLVPASSRSSSNVPLLDERTLWLESDGRVVGMTEANWQWGFARSLIARLDKITTGPFVSAWYHGTTAFMFQHRIFGEVAWHLPVAAALLPRDSGILLDQGCAAEQEGLPRSQAVVSDGTPVLISRGMGIRSSNAANDAAEKLFRQAVERDANQFEARLRLSRLLNLKKRYAEALAILTDAPPNTAPDESGEYLAHLFAARAEQGLGRLDAAAARVVHARTLAPNGQSAMMAASQIAMLRADVTGAVEAMEDLAQLPPDRHIDADPWWTYETCTGRYAETLLAAMWRLGRNN
jgi:hypothetical protein